MDLQLPLTPSKKRGRPKGFKTKSAAKRKHQADSDADAESEAEAEADQLMSDLEAQSEPTSEPDLASPKTPKRARTSQASGSHARAAKTRRSPSPPPGEWTPDKRAEFMDTIIANGYKATNLDVLGVKVSSNRARQKSQEVAPEGC
jgi:hypothetical protein